MDGLILNAEAPVITDPVSVTVRIVGLISFRI